MPVTTVAGHPPGEGLPPPPRHAAPAGHASQGDSAGPPHPHTRAHSTWVADPDSLPRGWAARGGGAPDLRRPSQQQKAPPPGRPSVTPTARNAGPQGRTLWGRYWVPTPTPRIWDTRVAEPRPPAPEDERPGGGKALDTRRASQKLQIDPAGDGPPPTPRHAAPTGHASQGDSAGPRNPHTRTHSTWVADPDSPPRGRAVGGGEAPDLRRPSQRRKAPPHGTPFRSPHSAQRRPARAHAVGPVLGPHAHTSCTLDTRVEEPRLPAPEDGRPG